MNDSMQRRLQAYYESSFPTRQRVQVSGLVSMTAGWEHEMYAFDVEYGLEDRRREALVLRIYPGDRAQEKSEHEFHSMRRLHHAGYPVPYVHILEHTNSPVGKPFVIMERIEGQVMGLLSVRSAEEKRRELRGQFCELLVRLHGMDWRPFVDEEVSYDKRGPYVFVDWYLDEQRDILREHSLPGFLPIVDWLQERRDHVPCLRPSVVHGDFHAHNILIREDGSPIVIDWTAVHVSDPRVDLALTLLIVGTYAGKERRDSILHEYERLAGYKVRQLEWFEMLACLWKLRTVVFALAKGPGKLGWHPDALATIKRHMSATEKAYNVLLQRTGIRVAEVERVFASAS